MESKFVSVVVYLHNTENQIEPFFDSVLRIFKENFEKYEIICVNDASTDDSAGRLRSYFDVKKSEERAGMWKGCMIHMLHMGYFHGLEASMNAGRDMAIGDFVYEFDDINADYEPQLIRQVYDRMLEGYDIVAASCRCRIKFTSRLFYACYNITSRSRNKIGQETFRILSRRAINRVMRMGRYIPYRKAVYMNCGLKTDIVYYDSLKCGSRHKCKTNRSERTNLAVDSFIYFTDVVERLSLLLSEAFLFFTLCVLVYIIGSVFSENKPVEGWLSTMGFLSLGFFGVFSLLTIILKYLSVLLNLVFKHQRYLVESVEKIARD